MKGHKDETMSIRTTANIKQLLRIAADREHRSLASMMEVLILNYAQEHGLSTNMGSTADTPPEKERDGAH